MSSIRELANHIIAVANDNSIRITNLQLQKIMFFVFGRMVKNCGAKSILVLETYDEKFEKWSTGPVIESIYFSYNQFGGRPIEDNSVYQIPEYVEFNERVIHLLKVNPFKLISITQGLPSWYKYEENIKRRLYVPPYDIEDFEREFI